MKTRRPSTKTEATDKPSAAERTIPIPAPEGTVRCNECEEDADLAKVTRRPDGSAECPSCGAVLKATATKPNLHLVNSNKAAPGPGLVTPGKPLDPEKLAMLPPAYCEDCGTRWLRGEDGRPFPNCGHTTGFKNKVGQCKLYKPPAGHQYDPELAKEWAKENGKPVPESPAVIAATGLVKEINEHRDAVRQAVKELRPVTPTTTASAPTLTVYEDRVVGEFGKAMFRIGDYATFTIGPFSLTAQLGRDEHRRDPVEAGKEIVDQLLELADHAFDVTSRWYLKKGDMLDAAIEAWQKAGK